MPRLASYFAKRALTRIAPDLPDSAARAAQRILDLLDEDDGVRVGVVNQTLFPYSGSAASANAQLNRLVGIVNKTAQASGSSLRIMLSADKKLGQKRLLWFEGQGEGPAASRTPELSGTSNLIQDTKGIPASGPAVVLLTFNEAERQAVLEAFAGLGPPRRSTVDDIDYTSLGRLAGHLLIHRHGHDQGQISANAETTEAIRHWSPRMVIAVGIAAGLKEDEQSLGDVLLPTVVRDTEMLRINADGSETDRNGEYRVFTKLIHRIKNLDFDRPRREEDWPTIHFGSLLCGNPLVDHGPSRQQLKADHPEAIGYEMESVGVAAAAERADVKWLIVKGISDWGDGDKNRDKAKNQVAAARNAAAVARAIVDDVLLGTSPHPPPEIRPRDLAEIPRSQLIDDTIGEPASLDKEAPMASGDGVMVMEYLEHWIDDPKAPPLFALLGEYGMGKTITCQRLYRMLRDAHRENRASRAALYFDLRHVTGLDKRLPSLAEIVEECLERGLETTGTAHGFGLDHVLQWMEDGTIVIFDGLDEVLVKLTGADGQVFTNTLLKLLAEYQARPTAGAPAKLLISCRTQYFRTLRDQRNHFTGQERDDTTAESYRALILLPLAEDQVTRYIENALPGTDLDRLLEMIRSVHNLTELTQRPYTLKLVSEFIPEIEADHLAGRTVQGVSLYRKMARRWLERDSGKHHIRPRDKLRLAADLAAHLWRDGGGGLDIHRIENWFHLWLADQPALAVRYAKIGPEQLEEDLRTATFLRREDGDVGSFRFAHTSLQEFFLADYLLEAIRRDRPELWTMPLPSRETLDFLGQMLLEDGPHDALSKTMQGWRAPYREGTSELLLAYALRARARGWPMPVLHGIDLRGSDLSGLELGDRAAAPLVLGPADFRDATLRRARFAGVQMDGADFSGARLEQALFQDCRLNGAKFAGASLSAAIFRRCPMKGTRFDMALGHRPRFLKCADQPPLDSAAGLISPLVAPHPDWPRLSGRAGLSWEAFVPAANACAFSPDGSHILSAGDDGTLRLWGAESGEEIMVLRGHENWVRACAFSPDGGRILSAGYDGTLRLWGADSGNAIRVHGHVQGGGVAVWEPGSNRVISVTGEAWRVLNWRLREVQGVDALLPLDSCGPLASPDERAA
ncbi:MAG: pentapeptide repeat-containing protein [Alphaproteobacteria bacterium]|nr:pentapeptide repeat-containing protein [Alphaproteobacteria bacterium]